MIEVYPLQIYTSLIFIPTESVTRNSHYVKPVWVMEEPEISPCWDSCLLSFETFNKLVSCVAWSRDGMLASVSWNHAMNIWDPVTGQSILQHAGRVTTIAWSQDGMLASDDAESILHVWDLSKGQCELRLESQTGAIHCISWLRDGRLALLLANLTARIWDPITGQWILSKLKRQGEAPSCSAFSDDGKLAIVFKDNAIQIWDLATNLWITALNLKGHTQEVIVQAWSLNGRLASGSKDLTVRIWDPATSQCMFILEGHNAEIGAVAWSYDGRLASGSVDRTIRIWNSVNGQCISILHGHSAGIISLAWSRDGRLASGSSDNSIKIWDPASAPAVQTSKLKSGVASIDMSKDPSRMASSARDETLQVCEPSTGHITGPKSHSGQVLSLAWSPNGTQLASFSGEVIIWDFNTKESILLDRLEKRVWMHWSPDGDRLASESRDRTIIVWDLRSGQRTVLEGHNGWVMSVVWSPLGDRLASELPNAIQIWSIATGQSIVISKPKLWHSSIIWSTDGRRLALWSLLGSFIIWDSTTGQRLCELNIDTDIVRCIDSDSWNLRKEIAVSDAWYKIPPADMWRFGSMGSSALSISYSLWRNDHWICFEGQKLLWLPPEYRPDESDSFISDDMTRLAFGCSTGRIWTITLASNGPVGESIAGETDSDWSSRDESRRGWRYSRRQPTHRGDPVDI